MVFYNFRYTVLNYFSILNVLHGIKIITMNYLFIDKNPRIVEAWREALLEFDNVTILEGDITSVDTDAIVSPANSFGFMDGGVDYAISVRLGWDLHLRLQKKIKALPEGELLVGRSLVLETGDSKIPYLISAPTMRVPMSFNIQTSVNAYLAMKAVLIAAKQHPKINSITIPGFLYRSWSNGTYDCSTTNGTSFSRN